MKRIISVTLATAGLMLAGVGVAAAEGCDPTSTATCAPNPPSEAVINNPAELHGVPSVGGDLPGAACDWGTILETPGRAPFIQSPDVMQVLPEGVGAVGGNGNLFEIQGCAPSEEKANGSDPHAPVFYYVR